MPTGIKPPSKRLEDSELDFIGGPYVPRWSMLPPEWMPVELRKRSRLRWMAVINKFLSITTILVF